MTIVPTSYDSVTQIYTMYCSDFDHEFELPLAEIKYATDLATGNQNTDVIVTPCPNDGTVTYHPISGGAAAKGIQLMAIRVSMDKLSISSAEAIIRERAACLRLDGPDRYQLTIEDIAGL